MTEASEHDRTHRRFIRKALRAGVGQSFRFPPFADRVRVLSIDAHTVTVLTGDQTERVFPRAVPQAHDFGGRA